ncbi:putative cyclin-dependent serine/threonine-protein kinase DDB_G0272797/DDB_G0274007 [Phoenix dactylifera]|uniref:Cyclin-dependent serine/threonine-protein kinase DDB_G0272797/DDB_G0274007 n=1 Tax=Phoenix dactylifera TaxID=42345 RepID=A0A8B7CFP1_PHODC|nr:putative cyclin-dependent serine/threonine-protein kinase DDB_G0272797/DDB_G0274007 [Phoenix dactylifera]
MASGGSSGRAGLGSQSFDFGSDDVLCSYDDYAAQDNSNGKRSDPPRKDFHEMGRPLVNIYEQEDYSKEEMIAAVEKCMKKYADNVLRFLEGISGRLSQLDLHCYKIERSIGEFRSDVIRDQNEAEMKFKSLEKHLQEVQRSVQIMRDKQELAEAQKELAKLQLGHKESTQKNEEVVIPSSSETKQHDDKPDVANRQLALALPHQTVTQASALLPMHQPAPVQQGRYILNQSGTYYPQRQPLHQDQHSQPLQPELQYVQQRPQIQDFPVQAPQQQPQIVNQTQQPYPQYQQQWPQQAHQFSQQVVQPPKPVSQAQAGPQAPPHSYPPCPPQSANPVPESYQGSMAMQVPYTTISQPVGNRPEAVPFGYGGPGSTVSQPLPQHSSQRQPQPPTSQSSFGLPLHKGGYVGPAPYTPPLNAQSYNTMYSYPPSIVSAAQNPQLPSSNVGGVHHPGLQLMPAQPYGEMIEKAVSMGYARDHAASAIQRMGESGQPIDFNSLLDRLNGQAGGASPRIWSG